jgi:hypothetical protein
LEVTKEYHRVGAVKGVILDADGTSEIYDLFDEFGITKETENVNFATADVKMVGLNLKRYIESKLGGVSFAGVQVLCGQEFFSNLVTNDSVKAAFDRWQDGRFLREDQRFVGFEFPTGVFWEEYRGQIGSAKFIADDKAHAFPVGVRDLFVTAYAPANFMETVNTLGKPYYAKQEMKKFDLGVDLFVQSNPLSLCTQPEVLVELTDTTP